MTHKKQSHKFEKTRYTNLIRDTTSGVLYYRFKIKGKQERGSLGTKLIWLGRQKVAEVRKKLIKRTVKKSANTPFDVLCKEWLLACDPTTGPHAKRSYQGRINALEQHFSGAVRNITANQIRAWASHRSNEMSAATYNEERRILLGVLDMAVEEGCILDNPARGKMVAAKKPGGNKPVEIPAEEEYAAMIEELRRQKGESSDAAEFLTSSGCRDAELLGDTSVGKAPMIWGQCKPVTLSVNGKGKGGGKWRDIPMFPALRKLLERMIAQRGGVRPPNDQRIFSIEYIDAQMRRACKKAGIRRFHPHSLRHLFCSRAIERGVDFKTISIWLGHTSPDMVIRTYSHLRPAHSEASAKLMDHESPALPENVIQMPGKERVGQPTEQQAQ